ncbi:MAG: 6-pyruvoyl tetrahydropterin synthase family protein [Thermoplasmata archaeon]|nr:6-pyruvoyl tetrahydropterin synthase family protein [Thermoplasmata archaeon]
MSRDIAGNMKQIDSRRTLEIDGWRLGIRFSSSHLLPHHNKCSRLHGHTYVVKLKVTGKLNEEWMVADFGLLKDALKRLTAELDHKLLLPGRSKTVRIEEIGESIRVDNSGKIYVVPKEDVVILPIEATTAENISSYILSRLIDLYPPPEGVVEISLAVDEGWGQGAWSIWRREQ